MGVKGYKVFNPDWTCTPCQNVVFQYKVGEIFKQDGPPICCYSGFHFCERASDCFNYYKFNPNNKVAEVVALGEIDTEKDKSCTNIIQIVREVPWHELLDLVNMGRGCSGHHNSGDYNCGDYNSGHYNSGSYNAGDFNSGNLNVGNHNAGDFNVGDYNSGNRNVGDFNSGDYSNGCFNTKTSKIYMFNKPSDWTFADWTKSKAALLLTTIPNALKYRQDWWTCLGDKSRSCIKSIPNFDAGIFKEITGIDTNL